MKPIFKTKINKKGENYAQFVFEPLPQGFGHTLGNSLRRILLTSLTGAAISRIKIKGVKHQFSTIPGLKEDVIELILNLKKINFRVEAEKEVLLKLSKKGPGEITAEDIKTPANVSIVNKKEYLGSLVDNKSKIEMQIWVEQGRGYLPSEERNYSELGIIPVDSFFTPVRRVNYHVEETRVGRATNFDKLIFEVLTNGAVSPKEALEEGARILVSYFEHIYQPKKTAAADVQTNLPSNFVLQTSLEELELPVKLINALKKAGLKTIADVCQKEKKELEGIKNIGVKSLSLLKTKLKEKGVYLKAYEKKGTRTRL